MKKITFKIDGMSCEHCAKRVEDSLKSIDNVNSVKVNLKKKEADVTYKDDININLVQNIIEEIGYIYKEISK